MTHRWSKPVDRAALIVAGVALLLQLAHLATAQRDPTFLIPVVDAATYHASASRFASGGPLATGAFFQPPLFPLTLGCLYRLTGPSVPAATVVLAALAAVTCVLMWWVGARLFSRRVGLLAGLMLAACGPFLFFSAQLLPVGLAVFLDVLAIAQWVRCLEKPRWHRWLLFGLAVGVATITVPNAGVLLALALVPVAATCGMPKPKAPAWLESHGGASLGHATLRFDVSTFRRFCVSPPLRAFGFAVLGAAVPILSVTARNIHATGQWVAISTNAGINFYVGNNPRVDETLAVRPGEQWSRLLHESFHEAGPVDAAHSRHFLRRSLRYLVDDPLDFLGGLGRKTIRLINAREIPRNVDVYLYRDFSAPLRVLLWRFGSFAFPFGLLAPLAAVGLTVSMRSNESTRVQRRGSLGLSLVVALYGASIVLFFVSARYRLPLTVFLTLFAAAGLDWAWRQFFGSRERRASRRTRATVAAVFAAVAVAVNLPITVPTDGVNFRAERAVCIGQAYASAARLDEAERHLRLALELDPRCADARGKLANALARGGELLEAEQEARRALTLDQHSLQARWVLGDVLHRQGKLNQAADAFRDALSIDPSSPEAHAGFAEILLQTGRLDEAIDHYERAAQAAHEPGTWLIRLADTLVQANAYEAAIERYRKALMLIEPDVATLNRIAWLLATCPQPELRDCERAVIIAEHVCELTGYAQPVALDTLAASHAECGRLERAVVWASKAVLLAEAQGDEAAAESSRSRLRLYRVRLRGRMKIEE